MASEEAELMLQATSLAADLAILLLWTRTSIPTLVVEVAGLAGKQCKAMS